MQPEPPVAAANAADRSQGRRGNFLSAAEVAEELGVDVTTVYRLAKSGGLPALQLRRNGLLRIPEGEFRRWLYGEGDAA
jgi:excisionase family DNA binding protein